MISKELVQKIRRIEITTNKLVNEVMAGQYQSAFKGQGVEFSEVREYMPGDDIRTIDWNVTARFGKPFVKRYIEERELTVLFLNDVSGSQWFGVRNRFKGELAAEISAVLAFSAIRNNDQVGSILFTDRIESFIPPKKGTQHVLRVIRDLLTTHPPGRSTNIGLAVDYLNRVQKRRSVVFLVSDFMDRNYEKTIRTAARRHDLVVITIDDPLEREFPDVGFVSMQDAESGKPLLIDLSKRSVRDALVQEMRGFREERDAFFASAGIDHLKLETHQAYESALHRFMSQRARRMR